MCRAPFSGRKFKGQGHSGRFNFWPCPLRGFVPIWLHHFMHDMKVIWSFCRVLSVASCFFDWITLHVAYIQHMRVRCVAHRYPDERSKVKITWVIWSFYLVHSIAFSLFDRIISYCHMLCLTMFYNVLTVWKLPLTTRVYHDRILNTSWAVGLTYWIVWFNFFVLWNVQLYMSWYIM